ncbi:MAG: GlsB/YeaQ/YmgE family stress response membrane protein [Betaproteobacteria bacterium]
MNIAIWILAGGVLGWASFALLKVNDRGGKVSAILVGMFGAFFGGNVLAPMLGAIADTPNDFSAFSLTIALVSATAFLTISSLLSRRFGV